MLTIEKLRKQGWKVLVYHFSSYHTEIIITDPYNIGHAKGVAVCHYKDQPNRKMGNIIAVGRAMKNWKNKNFCALPIDKAIEL